MGSGASKTKVEKISINSQVELSPGIEDYHRDSTVNNNYKITTTKGDNLNKHQQQREVTHPSVCVEGLKEDNNLQQTSDLQNNKSVEIESKMASKSDAKMKKELSEDSEDDNDSENEGEDNPEGKTAKKKVPKTLEEYKELEMKHLERAKSLLETLAKSQQDGDDETISSTLVAIKKMYMKLISAPLALRMEYRHKLATIIVQHGVYVPLICDKIVGILKDGNYRKSKEDEFGSKNYDFASVNLAAMMNYSDCSDEFREAFGNHEPLLMIMSEKLLEWADDHLNKTIQKEEESFIKKILGIAHNLAILSTNVPLMRKHGFIHSCLPYLDSRFVMYKLSALATLADLANEDECELIKANEKSIALLLRKLDSASHKKTRRESGWSAAELGRTVGRLARNDNNKKLLVTLGCLPLLLYLTTSPVPVEQEESIEALWVLAFDEENQPKMVEEPNLIDTIDKLRRTTDGNVKKLCNGILWTLQKVLRADENFKHLVEIYDNTQQEKSSSQAVNQTKKAGHVMISYQWDTQAIMKKVTADLRKDNWTVWMDIDNMEGSTLQAMANAIEGAKVVVICMSQKYKDSPNCRAEAEYAFQLRRPIIPLIMERGYSPDGWLGFILGAKLYYDFSGKYSFESRIDGLIKGVRQIYEPQNVGGDGSGGKEITAPPPAIDETEGQPIQKQRAARVNSSPMDPKIDEAVLKWSAHEVSLWLKKHNIQSTEALSELTGMELIFLRDLKLEAPEFFYRSLEEKLGMKKLQMLAMFTKAIQDLSI